MSGGGQVEYSAPFPLLHSAMAKNVLRGRAKRSYFRVVP